jgi:hypothetical protein
MPKTPTTGLRVTERVSQALELRRAGHTFDEIGRAMGCTRQRAHQLVRKGMARIMESADETAKEVRALELSRLDGVLLSHWPKRDNPRSAEVVLRVCERRSKLLGLDAPEKTASTDPNGNAIAPTWDLSKLSNEELQALDGMYEKMGDPQASV